MRIPRAIRTAVGWRAVGCLAVVIAVGAFVVVRHSASRSQTAVAHDFVRDLNARDARGLRSDMYRPTAAEVAAVIAHARLPWAVMGETIEGTTPTESSAYVAGTAGGQPLAVYLGLQRHHGRWYVLLANPDDPQAGPAG